jgi:hypothetical protein
MSAECTDNSLPNFENSILASRMGFVHRRRKHNRFVMKTSATPEETESFDATPHTCSHTSLTTLSLSYFEYEE